MLHLNGPLSTKVCGVILRTEFAATYFGMGDDESTVLFLYSELPFGRRAIPWVLLKSRAWGNFGS